MWWGVMAIRSEYLKHLRIDPRPKLFGFSAPGPVRLRALRDLEDRPDSDFLVRHATKDCHHYEPLATLLSHWRTDGTWGTDRLFLRAHGEGAALDRALVDATRFLTLLHCFAWRDADEPRLAAAADSLLARAHKDGFLGFISRTAEWIRGEHTSVLRSDHWGGYAAAALLRLGVDHPALDRYVTWLQTNQRADGGWLPEYHARTAARGEPLPSHPLHTAAGAAALAAHPRMAASPALKRAVDFLLDRCFQQVGAYARSSADRWSVLNEPDFGYGIIAVLARATDAGLTIADERVARIASILREAQQDTGFWIPDGKRLDEHPDEGIFLTLAAASTVRRLIDVPGADAAKSDDSSSA
jgi:hypothetical protein